MLDRKEHRARARSLSFGQRAVARALHRGIEAPIDADDRIGHGNGIDDGLALPHRIILGKRLAVRAHTIADRQSDRFADLIRGKIRLPRKIVEIAREDQLTIVFGHSAFFDAACDQRRIAFERIDKDRLSFGFGILRLIADQPPCHHDILYKVLIFDALRGRIIQPPKVAVPVARVLCRHAAHIDQSAVRAFDDCGQKRHRKHDADDCDPCAHTVLLQRAPCKGMQNVHACFPRMRSSPVILPSSIVRMRSACSAMFSSWVIRTSV